MTAGQSKRSRLLSLLVLVAGKLLKPKDILPASQNPILSKASKSFSTEQTVLCNPDCGATWFGAICNEFSQSRETTSFRWNHQQRIQTRRGGLNFYTTSLWLITSANTVK